MTPVTTELSNCYRVTDLPQLTDLDNQDLFLISHVKDQYGNYESQSIPFRRLTRAVKNRGLKAEIALINELNENAVRQDEMSAYATAEDVVEMGQAAKTYIDGEVAKVHTHSNKAVLDQISGMNVGQFSNDAGYLDSDDFDFKYQDGKLRLSVGIKELSVDATDFLKDGMVESASYDPATKSIVLTFNAAAGKTPISVDVSDLADVYTAGDGLSVAGNEFSVDWQAAASKAWIGEQGFQKKTVFRDWTEAE